MGWRFPEDVWGLHPDETRLRLLPWGLRSMFPPGFLCICEWVLMNEQGQKPGRRDGKESPRQMGGWAKGGHFLPSGNPQAGSRHHLTFSVQLGLQVQGQDVGSAGPAPLTSLPFAPSPRWGPPSTQAIIEHDRQPPAFGCSWKDCRFGKGSRVLSREAARSPLSIESVLWPKPTACSEEDPAQGCVIKKVKILNNWICNI